MELKSVKIGNHEIKHPIIQGGMGLGISWDKLAGSVSKEGGLGVISAVGTGYYQDKKFSHKNINSRPFQEDNFYSKDGLFEIIKNAREICKDKPLAVNILYASNNYGEMVKNACEAGIDIIITGAGLPLTMPDFAKDYPNVALVPIVSSAKALKIICKRWQRQHNRLPDAVIVEGPLSGGHQGFTYEQCFEDEFQLENILPPVVKEAKNWNNIPVFAAGGVWDRADIDKMMELGASGVQMGTRFIGTYECDASDEFKDVLLESTEDRIKLIKSPVGYPARGIKTNLFKLIDENLAPKVKCISNCVGPCNRGEEAKMVGYCIADRLSDAYIGRREDGLFFTGANGYKLDKIISVKELMQELTKSE
jgi:nitronate monooxygenase